MSQVDDIKSRLDIIDVITEYIQLKPAGSSHKALCPFHNEKTPSFMVSRERQSWHCFGCFPPGQKIKTPFGFHNIEDIPEGHYVYSGNGALRKVLATHKRNYHGNVVDVYTRKLGGMVSLTEDHQIYVVRPRALYLKRNKYLYRRYEKYSKIFKENPKLYYEKINKYMPLIKIAAGNIQKGDFVLYPINCDICDIRQINLKDFLTKKHTFGPVPREIPYKIDIDEKFLRLIGYWIAEGSNHRAYLRFSLGSHEKEFAREIIFLIKKIFGLEAKIYQRPDNSKKSGIEITVCHAYLADIFETLCSKGAENKHIPYIFQALPPKKQLILLDAIFKGDGHSFKANRSKKIHKSICTISRILSEQLVDILLRNGYFPSLILDNSRDDKRGIHHRKSYRIYWSEEANSQHHFIYYQPDGIKYWMLPVKKIRRRGYFGPVYNLTVERDHSYVATNFSVANCGEGGDVISFVQKIENIDFPDALKILAQKAGVVLVREDPKVTSRKNLEYAMAEMAAKFWHERLLSLPQAQKARDYISHRKITSDSVEEFLLGYALESWDEMIRFLRTKGFSDNDIFLAGYSVKSEKSANFYDRFRNRIIFPIRDSHGAIVGFGGRILPGADPRLAKYINSPQTQIYNKSRVVYNLEKAKQHIKENNLAVMVEGYMDVIASHEAGVKNVVATSGTSLTFDHLKAIQRYAKNLSMAFDADQAGQNASVRGIDLILGSEMNLKVITLPFGKDPDECARENPQAWLDAVKKSEPFMSYMLKVSRSRFPDLSPESARGVIGFLLPFLSKITNSIERDFWLKEVSFYSGVSENNIREQLLRSQNKQKSPENVFEIQARQKKSRNQILEEFMVGIALRYPEHTPYIIDRAEADFLTHPVLLKLYKQLIIYYTQYTTTEKEKGFDYHKFSHFLASEEHPRAFLEYLNELLFLTEKEFSSFDSAYIKKEIEKIISDLHANFLRRKLNMLKVRLEEAEREKNSDRIRELSLQFSQIVDELHMLDRE